MAATHFKQQDLFQKVSLFLDNTLSNEEQIALKNEIDNNPACSEMLNREICFREFVKNRVQRRAAAPTLIQSIREKAGIAPL